MPVVVIFIYRKIQNFIFSQSTSKNYPNILQDSDSTAKITPSHLLQNPLNSTGSEVTLYKHLNLANITYTGQSRLEFLGDRFNQVIWCIRWSYLADLNYRNILYTYLLILYEHMMFLFLIFTCDHTCDQACDVSCDQAAQPLHSLCTASA